MIGIHFKLIRKIYDEYGGNISFPERVTVEKVNFLLGKPNLIINRATFSLARTHWRYYFTLAHSITPSTVKILLLA